LTEDAGRAAEATTPELLSDERNPATSGQVVSVDEIAAKLWPDSKNAEKIRCDTRCADSFRSRATT
jgi:predicted ABC-type ATPase